MDVPKIENLITTFLKGSTLFENDPIFSYDEDTKTLWCMIRSDDSRLLIGKNGETLQAINHIIRRVVEQAIGEEASKEVSVILDINNFQKKKVDNLKTLAHMMAERARFFKSSVDLDPMSPFDRRIIHEFLSEVKDIKTESEGVGSTRHVVIRYVSEAL